MSRDELLAEVTRLQQENAALANRIAAITAERERLIRALEALLPPPTEAELVAAEADVGGFGRLIDQMATELGVDRQPGKGQ